MNLKVIVFLIVVVAQVGNGIFVYRYGYDKGFSSAESKYQKADIKALEKVITKTESLIGEAERTSLAISKTISDRVKADQKTTQEFHDALSTTAHLRVDCVFDNNVMQQLGETANRADQAATAGFISAVPASAAPD